MTNENLIDRLKDTLPTIESALTESKTVSGETHSPCPECGGEDRFFVRKDGSYMCRGCEAKGRDAIDFWKWRNSTDLKGLAKIYLNGHPSGKTPKAADKKTPQPATQKTERPKARAVAKNLTNTYSYTDEEGKELFQVFRFEQPGCEKDFRQGKKCRWDGIKDIRRVIYNLPAAIKADHVIICEGEKDADNLTALKYTATTSPMGAKNWRDEYAEFFRGKNVAILPDSDEAGEVYLQKILKSLNSVAASIRIVRMPSGCKDVSDFIETFPSKDAANKELLKMLEAAPLYEPPAEAPSSRQVRRADERKKEKRAASEAESTDYIFKGDFLKTAEKFLEEQPERFVTHCGEVFQHADGAYIFVPPSDLAARTLLWAGRQIDSETKLLFKPSRNWRANVEDAIRALTNHPARFPAPCWLDGRDAPDAKDIISCANGLLAIKTRELMPPTSDFFTMNVVPFPYNRKARRAASWLKFLDEIFDGDAEAINTLQQIFGYFVSNDTSQQKLFLVIGPRRSGKGTLARLLTAMLGQENVCAPTLVGLSQNFGLATLLGKKLAIVGDARLSGRADQAPVVERLLSISGEDYISVPRKYLDDVTAKLPTRFLLLSNELPRLADASGALSSRFIVLPLTKSFYGRENLNLTNELLEELPSILNWSLDGLDILRERGHFVQPASGRDALQELEDLTSPISVFLRECCEIAPGARAEISEIFAAWQRWCAQQNRREAGTAQTFGRDLRSAVPGLVTRQSGTGRDRKRVLEGISVDFRHR